MTTITKDIRRHLVEGLKYIDEDSKPHLVIWSCRRCGVHGWVFMFGFNPASPCDADIDQARYNHQEYSTRNKGCGGFSREKIATTFEGAAAPLDTEA